MYDRGRTVRRWSSTEPSPSTSVKTQKGKVGGKEMSGSVLPERGGPRPRTTPTNPHHTQLEQNPKREVVEELARRVLALPGA